MHKKIVYNYGNRPSFLTLSEPSLTCNTFAAFLFAPNGREYEPQEFTPNLYSPDSPSDD